MTTSGLSATDVGIPQSIGGMAREFYLLVGEAYGSPGAPAFNFEPHVASDVFVRMLTESQVEVYGGVQVLAVNKQGPHISSLETNFGRVLGTVFVDATYEGDLLALSGVSFRTGREATSEYGEVDNGVTDAKNDHSFSVTVDPYMVSGVPDSGLLPLVGVNELAAVGTGDLRIQAYNFRLCLTTLPNAGIPVAPPPLYDAGTFELLGRYLVGLANSGVSLSGSDFLSMVALPNGKFDANTKGALSTDFIGGNSGYLAGDARARADIVSEHEAYTRGFFHFLATDPRVPASVQHDFQSYRLCSDEFVARGNWPPELYVREGRRMVGAYVMSEHDVDQETVPSDSVAFGSYTIDIHNTQRLAVDGCVRNEGHVQVAPIRGAYPISYRSITPQPSQATNLLVPVALSATHSAYGSMRMEPVFMMLGQAAGTAAALAIEQDVAVQAINIHALQSRLQRDGALF